MRLVCKATKEEFPAGAAKEPLPSVSQTWRGYSCRAWLMDEGTNSHGRGPGLGNSIGWVMPQLTARVWDPPQQCILTQQPGSCLMPTPMPQKLPSLP